MWVYNSVDFSILQCCVVFITNSRIFLSPPSHPAHKKLSLPVRLSSVPLTTTQLLSVPTDLPVLNHSCKQDHTTCVLARLTSLSKCSQGSSVPWHMSLLRSFLGPNDIPHYRSSTLWLSWTCSCACLLYLLSGPTLPAGSKPKIGVPFLIFFSSSPS